MILGRGVRIRRNIIRLTSFCFAFEYSLSVAQLLVPLGDGSVADGVGHIGANYSVVGRTETVEPPTMFRCRLAQYVREVFFKTAAAGLILIEESLSIFHSVVLDVCTKMRVMVPFAENAWNFWSHLHTQER